MSHSRSVPFWICMWFGILFALLAAPSAAQSARPAQTPPTPVTQSPSARSSASVKVNANLRSGPGTNYPRIGSVKAGQTIEIVARNHTGDWYQLASGAWIFGNLVDGAPDVPEAMNIPAPPTAAPNPASVAPATSPPSTKAADDPPQVVVKVKTNANLRTGPGTNYPSVGVAKSGQTLTIIGRNSTGTWYQTANGTWIFGNLLNSMPRVPVAADNPAASGAVSTPAVATRTPTGGTTGTGIGSVGRAHSLECSFDSPLACLDWLLGDPTRRNTVLGGLGLWVAALALMAAGRRWRWVMHSILVTVLLLPIGWFVTILSGLLQLADPDSSTSPRELLQNFVNLEPVQTTIGIVFLVLTAVSIFGGIIVFAILAIVYAIFLALLPGPDYVPSPPYPLLGHPEHATSGEFSDNRPDYDPYSSYPDTRSDDNSDDDDRSSGSIWDGWLVKW